MITLASILQLPRRSTKSTSELNEKIMKKLYFVIAIVFLLSGCAGIRLVSDYDEVIDKGVTDFAEQFNTHIKNMGDLAGTPEGTYDVNLKAYNALESKLDVMIARASAVSESKGCKLEKKVFGRIQSMLKSDMPSEIRSDDTVQTGNAHGCNERLLLLVKKQLDFVKEIHRETDKCGANNLSCLRPATAKTALSIANQSINAVSVVETAKKQ